MTKMTNKGLESFPCNFCGSETGDAIVHGGDLLEDLPGVFTHIRCDGCGVIRQNPRLNWDDLAEYYRPGYVCHGEQISTEKRGLKEKSRGLGPKKRVDRVARYKPQGNWLDVGCGSGLILQAAQANGSWHLSGIEPVDAMAKYTSEKLSIEVFSGTFEEYPVQEASLDVITMWDVLEHLSAPADSLRKVAQLLKEDGYFLFSTPNLDSLNRKIFQNTWLGYDLPRHLYLYPDSLIRKTLREFGMEVIDRFCFTGSHGAWYLDLAYRNKVRPNRLVGWLLKQGPSGLLFRVLTFLPLRILDRLKLGTNITFVARKI